MGSAQSLNKVGSNIIFLTKIWLIYTKLLQVGTNIKNFKAARGT